MKMFRVPFGYVALFVFLFAVLIQRSTPTANADAIDRHNPSATIDAPLGRVGPGLYEAECADTILPSVADWTFRKAARASSSNPNCSVVVNKNYLESKVKANKVCLDFKQANRVGVGYVAGNFKGDIRAVVTFTDASPTVTTTIHTYNSYSEVTSNGSAPVSFVPDQVEEGDFDSNSTQATSTFHAFQWAWNVEDPNLQKRGTLCVNPQGKEPQSGDNTISLDYFVVGSGDHKTLRGVGTGVTNLIQDDVGAVWNYDIRNFKFPDDPAPETVYPLAPANEANWKGFIPKLSGVHSTVSFNEVLNVITKTRVYGNNNVPAYWIEFNEEDGAGNFTTNTNSDPGNQPYPESTYWTNLLIPNMITVTAAYSAAGYTPPKFIITIGSQLHAPSLSNPVMAGDWGLEDTANVKSACHPNNPLNLNWGCTHRTSVWIQDFWQAAKPRLEANGLLPYIGGFAFHYYQGADPYCGDAGCRVSPTRVLSFAQAVQNWASQYSGLTNPEIWLVETSTLLSANCGSSALNRQRDLQTCAADNKKYNVRNYVGLLQNALAKQGIVNRWAWYADRWGETNPCHPRQDGTGSDGDESALNATCTGVTVSPFGNNSFLTAPYR